MRWMQTRAGSVPRCGLNLRRNIAVQRAGRLRRDLRLNLALAIGWLLLVRRARTRFAMQPSLMMDAMPDAAAVERCSEPRISRRSRCAELNAPRGRTRVS